LERRGVCRDSRRRRCRRCSFSCPYSKKQFRFHVSHGARSAGRHVSRVPINKIRRRDVPVARAVGTMLGYAE
jgi:hypothetical protein